MKGKISLMIFVVLLGIIASSILGGVEILTEERIVRNEELKVKSSLLSAFNIPYEKDTIEVEFDKNLSVIDKEDTSFYKTSDGRIGFAFDGSGLWGPISGFIVLDDNFKTIKGIEVLSQAETPGLGGVVGERDYLNTFIGKSVVPTISIIKSAGAELAENEIDAISGATMTSEAFELLLNESLIKNKKKWVN